jgi:two-component system cell cycle sensor histidine kinase/response regulator CckA
VDHEQDRFTSFFPMDGGASRPAPPSDPGPAVVLVVDDDDAVRQVAAKALRRAGYDVLQAGEGEEALRLMREHAGAVHLLLTDVVMPGMNGRELAERLIAEWPATRLLYMSAHTEDEVILRGVRVAEVNFLYKPFSIEALAAAVRSVLAT